MYLSNHGSTPSLASVPQMVWTKATPPGAQAAGRLLHVRALVLGADVLHEADRDDGVEAPGRGPVVGETDVDGEARVFGLRPRHLLARDRVADDRHAVALGRERCEAAPAAAEIEHAHAGLQADLAAHEVELGLLRGGRASRRCASRRRCRSCADRASPRRDRCRRRSGVARPRTRAWPAGSRSSRAPPGRSAPSSCPASPGRPRARPCRSSDRGRRSPTSLPCTPRRPRGCRRAGCARRRGRR